MPRPKRSRPSLREPAPVADPSAPFVLVIGAGPAGLTAAWELVSRGGSHVPGPASDTAPDIRSGADALHGVRVLVVDENASVGGLARTIVHAGNRIDIGGHRYHSRYPEIVEWWTSVLPLQGAPAKDDIRLGRPVPLSAEADAPDPERTDAVLLTRERLSRILFLGRFFDYPVVVSARLVRDLGLTRSLGILGSYLQARLRPVRPERSIEDFLVNRFGHTLYELFFRDYTHKHWGVHPREIPRDWGDQRFAGLSVWTAMRHLVASVTGRTEGVYRNAAESGLVGRFSYPKLGAGQLWETVADRIIVRGGDIRLDTEVVALRVEGRAPDARVASVTLRDVATGLVENVTPDAVISTMPVRDLVARIEGDTPSESVALAAAGLPYRDYVLACLLVERLSLTNDDGSPLLDDFIYVQDTSLGVGRLQLYKNWSPYLLADDRLDWIGLEYACDEGDETWSAADVSMLGRAEAEARALGVIGDAAVLDGTVVRVRKAYPAYSGAYSRFGEVREYLDGVSNLLLAGRNGTHRYNDMDRAMLTGMAAARCVLGGAPREAIWLIANGTDYVG